MARQRFGAEGLQRRQLGQHRGLGQGGQGGWVVRVERTVEHQAQQMQPPAAQGFHRQQGVVERAQATAGHQQHRQPPHGQLVDLQPVPPQGHQQAAGGFHHQGPGHRRQGQPGRIDPDPFALGGPVGRYRRPQAVGLRQQAFGGELQQGLQPARVAAALQAALHRFPVVGAQALHHQGADDGLAHVGVGAADHQLASGTGHGWQFGPGRWASSSSTSQLTRPGAGQWRSSWRSWPGARRSQWLALAPRVLSCCRKPRPLP